MRDIERLLAEECSGVRAEEWIEKTDPADDSPVVRIPVTSAEAVSGAVRTARAASRDWARTAPADRAAAVDRAADGLSAYQEELAWLTKREMGRPLDEARAGVAAGIATLRQYAQLGPAHRGRSLAGAWSATDLMVPEPRGVAAVITPWNDPVAVSCGLIGAALVTGNTVVYKPSERTPATGWLLHRLIAEELPDGVLTLVNGGAEVGDRLVREPLDVIAHVGSTATGLSIRRATTTKVVRENGGNDPLLVDEDVDPAWAAEQAATGAFANSGQICVAVERIYVHERIAASFLAELVKRAEVLDLAPLVDRRLRDEVHSQVAEAIAAGAAVQCGGEIPAGPGAFYPATVLAGCTEQMRLMREETFGPVAPVSVVASFEEGLSRAAAGEYGLAATVLTGSLRHAQEAWRELPVGTVKVNSVFGGAPAGAAHPRGASGDGYGYGPELLDEFTATKVVHWEAPPVPQPAPQAG
ncbi:MAG: aldehyde dehydrogenase [Hamadaea sp.]|nr:aldehyde dehydrogenase [Hamadaea sp.]